MWKPSEKERGPERIGEILSRLFAARGWGRKQERLQFEQAWVTAAGAEHALHSKVGAWRRGVLEILVDNAPLMQEMVHYHKRRLLQSLREQLPSVTITDLRFRAGK